jgi:hypothetical protein
MHKKVWLQTVNKSGQSKDLVGKEGETKKSDDT